MWACGVRRVNLAEAWTGGLHSMRRNRRPSLGAGARRVPALRGQGTAGEGEVEGVQRGVQALKNMRESFKDGVVKQQVEWSRVWC